MEAIELGVGICLGLVGALVVSVVLLRTLCGAVRKQEIQQLGDAMLDSVATRSPNQED